LSKKEAKSSLVGNGSGTDEEDDDDELRWSTEAPVDEDEEAIGRILRGLGKREVDEVDEVEHRRSARLRFCLT
jgi:hypothetical protein